MIANQGFSFNYQNQL